MLFREYPLQGANRSGVTERFVYHLPDPLGAPTQLGGAESRTEHLSK